MDFDTSEDVVLFEVMDVAASARLAERLARRWDVELNTLRRQTIVLLVDLRPGPEDLGVLLREVEEWVEDESLVAIRYEVDGRAYVLAAGEGVWPSADVRVGWDDEDERSRVQLVAALQSVERLEDRSAPIRGVEGLRRELDFALRLIDGSPQSP